MTAKVRPYVLLSEKSGGRRVGVTPHRPAYDLGVWEPLGVDDLLPFLREGAFHLQQIQPVLLARLERKLGEMSPAKLVEPRGAIVHLRRL